MSTQQRITGIVTHERRHVLAEDLTHLCPFAGRRMPCIWSNGTDCTVTTEHAKDCPLNTEEDRAACEEAAL